MDAAVSGGNARDDHGDVASVLARMAQTGNTIALAESVTGGLISAALTSVPGSSAVVRGAVVAYAAEVKVRVLRVDAELIAREGVVHPEVAVEMARGARMLLGATHGLATTGEAGPDSASGQPVGTVHVAAVGPMGALVATLAASGTRDQIRSAAAGAALEVLWQLLSQEAAAGSAPTGPASLS